MLSGMRREKEAPAGLDIDYHSTDPGKIREKGTLPRNNRPQITQIFEVVRNLCQSGPRESVDKTENSGYPVFAPGVEEVLARIDAQMGEPDAAIARIERPLPLAYGALPLTQARLRIDPIWDSVAIASSFQGSGGRAGAENDLSKAVRLQRNLRRAFGTAAPI